MNSDWQAITTQTATEHARFMAALRDPEAAQTAQLLTILERARHSQWGKRHGYGSIRTVADYQARHAPTDYAELAEAVAAMRSGEQGVLTDEVVLFMETTAGSSGGAKYIPYTASSLAALQRGLYPWLHDLLQHHPDICRGRTYWAISPPLRSRQATAPVPLGIANDALYFGEALADKLSRLMIVPEASGSDSFADWRLATLLALLRSRDLAFISVWSPTFLTDLLRWLEANPAPCLDALRRAGETARATELETLLVTAPLDTHCVWPQLALISCWTQGSAKQFLPDLQRYFPHLHIQGKGLLATEGMVTLPLCAAEAPVLALHSGFYEFIDAEGRVLTCQELEQDASYEVLLTTAAGLYRYRLGDRVRVRGWLEATPMLDFVGRAGLVSDLCGEKLDEAFVCRALQAQDNTVAVSGFAMLLPCTAPRGYVLVLDAAMWSDAGAVQYARTVEERLRANPQYALARELGQLQALRPHRVSRPWVRYRDFLLTQNRRLGDIKPPVLGLHPELAAIFALQPAQTDTACTAETEQG